MTPAVVVARLLDAVSARRDKYALAQLISRIEAEGEAGRATRAEVMRALAARPAGRVVGVTGAPGAGKSSLIGRLALELVARDAAGARSVAVVAVDPSSAVSGGAFLGDRVRTAFPVGEARLFFRSQASGGELGGVSRRTFAVTRLLRRLFDVVIVETVGIGQSEIEIRRHADDVLLVLQPLAGDHVQFLKAGIMEIPDAYVINKCDEEVAARRALRELRGALAAAGVGERAAILQTSARTGAGVGELAAWIEGRAASHPVDAATERERERWHLEKAVAEKYGKFGVAELEVMLAGEAAPGDGADWLERAETALEQRLAARLGGNDIH